MSDPQQEQSSEKIRREELAAGTSGAGVSGDVVPHTAASELVIDGIAMFRATFRTALETFYRTHNPERLSNVGTILERYTGREEQLVRHLEQKYSVNILKFAQQTPGETSPAVSASPGSPPQSASALKGNVVVHGSSNGGSNPVSPTAASVGEASARISESMQQVSQFTGKLLNAISLRTRSYVPDDGSNPEDSAWTARVRELESQVQQLQQDKQAMATSYQKLQTQMFNSKQDKQKLEAEIQELKRQKATLQTNVARLIESEARLTQANSEQAAQILQLQAKATELEQQLRTKEANSTKKDLQLKQVLELEGAMAAQLNFLTARVLLCHNVTEWHSVELTSDEPQFTSADDDLQEYSDDQLRNYVRLLRSSWRASRAELREALAAKERATEAIKEQHESNQALEQRAAGLSSQVDSMTSSLAELRTELEVLKYRHEATLRQLADSAERVATHERELEQLRAQLHEERTSNQIGQDTRRHLVQACTELVQDAQVRAGQTVSQLSERLMLEREDILAHFARVKFDEEQVQEWRKKEAEAELERLSIELFRSQQRETLKDREIRHLQRQLTEAAERIAKIEAKGV